MQIMVSERTEKATRITDSAIAEVRSRMGREILSRRTPNLEEATKDGIRHWVEAVGDLDLKWRDSEYAATTRFGGITAPPSILYALDTRAIGDRSGLPGIHSFFAGAAHEWYLPIRRNDSIQLRVVLTDLIEKSGSFAGRMLQQVSECTFTNQRGEIVARSWPWGMRTERTAGASRGKYEDLEPAFYSEAAIGAISEQYSHEHEQIRGKEVRYWEEVSIGDKLGPIIRGPWSPSVSVGILRAQGGDPFLQSHGYWYEFIRRHPKAGMRNDMGIPEGPIRGHWDNAFARSIGVPRAYDFGPERIGWLASLCTYWCGDDGWLKSLRVEVRRFNLLGDLTTLEGRVTGKSEHGSVGVVHAEIWARDQRGVDTATATADIQLPRRVGAEG
jgi:acyl dehydratase